MADYEFELPFEIYGSTKVSISRELKEGGISEAISSAPPVQIILWAMDDDSGKELIEAMSGNGKEVLGNVLILTDDLKVARATKEGFEITDKGLLIPKNIVSVYPVEHARTGYMTGFTPDFKWMVTTQGTSQDMPVEKTMDYHHFRGLGPGYDWGGYALEAVGKSYVISSKRPAISTKPMRNPREQVKFRTCSFS